VTVIGIMPQDFRFLNNDAELLLPQQFDRNKVFLGEFSYQGIARLKPGATLQQANTEMSGACWVCGSKPGPHRPDSNGLCLRMRASLLISGP
jgi:hypothetical protein